MFLEGALNLKKTACLLLILCLVLGSAVAARAEEQKLRNKVVLLGNDDGYGFAQFYLSDKFSVTGIYEDELLKAGFRYDPSERFGIKVGQVYNHDTEKDFTYGGIDFIMPFGNNLNIHGSYDSNYRGENWNSYEAALQIQMFKGHFIYAGVRGDTGKGVPIMEYNEEHREGPHLFLRGDFNWNWKKVSLSLNPLLYVKGYYYHDYTLKFHLKENADIVLNVNNYDYNINDSDDEDIKYRAGFEYRF